MHFFLGVDICILTPGKVFFSRETDILPEKPGPSTENPGPRPENPGSRPESTKPIPYKFYLKANKNIYARVVTEPYLRI